MRPATSKDVPYISAIYSPYIETSTATFEILLQVKQRC